MAAIATVAMTPQPASAAAASYTKTRSGCTYKYYSSSTLAWSQKVSGGCSGHAWVRATLASGFLTGWYDSTGYIEISASSSNRIVESQHKSQADETPWVHRP
jgi:hypothetical protein